KAAGHEVAVAYGQPGLMETKLVQAGIEIIPLPIKNEASVGAILKTKNILQKVFEERRPDVVHLNSSLVGISGAWAAHSSHIPKTIYTDHGWAFMEKRSLLARLAIWTLSWFTVLLVDKVIAVSEYELALTNRMPFVGNKAVRIYNGLDLNMEFGSGEIIRQAFPAGVKITGIVGELTKNKNQIALIEQAKNDSSMYLAIVGEGTDRAMLERKIKEYDLGDRVKMFGFQPATEVLKGFDVFALSSIKEALGFVILEARIAGLPIVALHRVGGVGEALDKPLSEFSKERMVRETLELYS
ncbi:glycosyltransferase family 4 protein, partial [Patescibacteria group bacterium]|nr:glycosyltransferase family 4 protein [Patescibacteria group bacterium]